MELFDVIIDGIYKELIWFFTDLNWTYIIIMMLAFWGIKYNKEDFSWYDKFLIKPIKADKFRTWIAGIIVALFFLFFRWRDSINDTTITFDSFYISALLRSLFFAVSINKILIEIVVVAVEKLGKMIRGEEKKDDDKDEIIKMLIKEIKTKD
jgi:hypothetical protein